MPWFEVESKIKITDYEKLRRRVRQIASLVRKENKFDSYFAPLSDGYPKKAFRVRFNGQKYIVNFKKHYKKLYDKQIVVKKEFEFAINSKPEYENFIFLCREFGFVDWLDKRKICETFSYNKDGHLHIELNKVSSLGNWMEIEYLCSKQGIPRAKKTIRRVISELAGHGTGRIDNTGYTKMLYKRK